MLYLLGYDLCVHNVVIICVGFFFYDPSKMDIFVTFDMVLCGYLLLFFSRNHVTGIWVLLVPEMVFTFRAANGYRLT